jgi:uncharacterized protein (DUF305 family)
MIATGALAVVLTAACATAPRSGAGEVRSAERGRLPYTAADVSFMSGMIAHHAQAVLMAGWAPTHGASPGLRTLSERIDVAQRDEIALMQRWLEERHEPVPDPDPSHDPTMSGSVHPMLMPGMLTPEELAQLDRARGPEFDRLFLTFMIRHHQGAITMVEQLFSTQGAVQDESIFRVAADVQADQAAEIDRMSRMLAALSSATRS